LNIENCFLFLSPLQARTAFGTYLQRIQFRLMLDSELKEDVTSTQHMELVIRFLKRAGQNLSPPFRVEIPSRRLSQADQKRILAKELCDFLHLYNKETVSQYQNEIFSSNEIDNRLFENFLRSACEADLEQMMTAYMKNNKNSAIHLGVNPKMNKFNSNQQGSDVGPDQQAQTILPKQSIEDKTITFIQTISSNEQSNQKWATLSTQNDSPKRLLRASSASRQRNNHKRHDDIYKLYGVSRPVSAVVQHRKRIYRLSTFTFQIL
jgi:tubulin polyglutamylase TTLL5